MAVLLIYFPREEAMFEKKFEDLELPTTRLVRRRRHLGRVYEQVSFLQAGPDIGYILAAAAKVYI